MGPSLSHVLLQVFVRMTERDFIVVKYHKAFHAIVAMPRRRGSAKAIYIEVRDSARSVLVPGDGTRAS